RAAAASILVARTGSPPAASVSPTSCSCRRASMPPATTRWRSGRRWRSVAADGARANGDVMFAVENLVKHYTVKVSAFQSEKLRAVDGVSLEVRRGTTLGLVGESGCGKSTLGRVALRLEEPTAGVVRFGETALTSLGGAALRRLRPKLQMVFQNPLGSLNPRMTVGQAVAE